MLRAHLAGENDELVIVRPVLDRVDGFADLLDTDAEDSPLGTLRAAETTGRALGKTDFNSTLRSQSIDLAGWEETEPAHGGLG